MNSISTARLDEVHPTLKTRVLSLDAQFTARFPEADLEVSQGLRSWNLQAAYYAQGREPLDQVNERRAAVRLASLTEEQNAKAVTNAPAGYSNHEYGIAVDFDIQLSGNSLDWDSTDARWLAVVALAPTCQLRSGEAWKDEPHVELPEFPTKPTDEMRQILQNQGVEAVWQTVSID